ncbi:MAG: hypothetical protein HYX52_02055 [Chloroflexi bacterium]|nr:hypothetical protein [Chloroflexota bacterium]
MLELYVLVDFSSQEPDLMRAVIRAMRDEFFKSEARSLTNSLRFAIHAGHFVLRSHNAQALPHERVTAAVACAVSRQPEAFVALAGEAAALAFDGEHLEIHRPTGRVPRPLGGDDMPTVGFWSAPLGPGCDPAHWHVLALACGAAWMDSSAAGARKALSGSSTGEMQERLAEALAGPEGPARTLVAEATHAEDRRRGRSAQRPSARSNGHVGRRRRGPSRPAGSGTPPPTGVPSDVPRPRPGSVPPGRRRPRAIPNAAPGRSLWARGRHTFAPLPPALRLVLLPLGLALSLIVASLVMNRPFGEPVHVALARQAEVLVEQAQASRDVYQAHRLAADARSLAEQANTQASGAYTTLLDRTDRLLREVDRVYSVLPVPVVRSGADQVVDLAVSSEGVFTLGAQDGAVRQFDAFNDQTLDSGRVVLKPGDAVSGGRVDTAVALVGRPGGEGPLVVDRSRSVWSRRVGTWSSVPIAGGAAWTRVDAVTATQSALLVFDGGARTVSSHPLNGGAPVGLIRGLESALEVVASDVDTYARLADGRVLRFDRESRPRPFDPQPPDSAGVRVSAMARDSAGTLYLADPSRRRIVQVTADGRFIRQIVSSQDVTYEMRALQVSPQGDRLYGLDRLGVVAWPLPAEVPAAVAASPADGTPSGGAIQPPK